MSKKEKERKFESTSQDFFGLEVIPTRKNSPPSKQIQKQTTIKPIENQLDVVFKLIKFLKD